MDIYEPMDHVITEYDCSDTHKNYAKQHANADAAGGKQREKT
jgi:hypothetical protein